MLRIAVCDDTKSFVDGLETAEQIRVKDCITSIIFISGSDDYYKEAYKFHPFHFLSKPTGQHLVNDAMDAFTRMKGQDRETFSFIVNKSQYTLPLSEILYFGSERRRIHVVCEHADYLFYGKLSQVQELLGEKNTKFLRIHQSYLVNMKYIREYHYKDVVMSNGDVLLISRERRKDVRNIQLLQNPF